MRSRRQKKLVFSRLTNQVSLSRLEELYNVRPGFQPLKTFQKGARILIILIKAGGCFGNKTKLTVGQDEAAAVCYDTVEASKVEGAASFNPRLYEADRNLKLGRDVVKGLRLHPSERKPELVEKIMRAVQLVLDTFADYPLGMYFNTEATTQYTVLCILYTDPV